MIFLMELLKKYVGHQLKRAMRIRSVDQKELAEHLEVDQSNVSRWLKGQTMPTDENFDETCHFLEMEPEDVLFPDEGTKNDLIVAAITILTTLNQSQLESALTVLREMGRSTSAG